MSRALLLCLCAATALAQQEIRVIARPPSGGGNRYYTGNRAPLLPSALIKLPPGAVQPRGYLRHQLELMAAGFTGHLTEISQFCRREGNAWVERDGLGAHGWEEVPYWLRGYYDLGLILGEPRILAEANQWLDGVLSSQRPDGWFGAQGNLLGERLGVRAPDLWPNMVMLYPLRARYEATGDRRILDFLLRYFRWQSRLPLDQVLPESWQKWRAGDNLDSIYWLYNRTGQAWLLDLARVNHERTADWVGGIPTWHVVNIAECFREPAQYYQQTRDMRYLRATERDYETVRGIYGQVPGGMYGADENARPGFTGPRQGTETCGFVEMLFSDEMLTAISGNPVWADRAEEIAFNSLPAAMTPDLKGLHYLTAPNQVQLDRANKAPLIDNAGDMFSYNPYQYRCCQHNVAFGWPYFAEHLWMATEGEGLAAVLYAPSEVTAQVAGGEKVKITETTAYPFGDAIDFAVSSERPARFPLLLRIPGWAQAARLSVNGKSEPLAAGSSGWVSIDRTWNEGDRVRLVLPMRITVTEWKHNLDTVSVNRGPLTYSLRIGERWERRGGTDAWPGQEVYPATPWNYGLELDAAHPERSFEVVVKGGALADQPFTLDAAPVMLRAKGRRIPQWKQEPNGMVGEVQPGPVRSSQPEEPITLVPMGCARLRIAAFPRIGDGPSARVWMDAVPIVFASHATPFDHLEDVRYGVEPPFTWPASRGEAEWIEYQWSAPRRLQECKVRWAGAPPESWTASWWDGKAWQPVAETGREESSRLRFAPVTTTRLRLQVRLARGGATGLREWRAE